MGAGWRRVKEKVKQSWQLNDKTFIATSNARNEHMLKEAGDFANHLKHCERDIRALKNATEGLLMTTKTIMAAPLPRVFEESAGGKAVPVPTAPGQNGNIGGDFRADELVRVSKDTSKKLEAEVLAPMARWTTAYQTVQGRMKRLEQVRLEVDSRRHTVTALGHAIEKQRAKLAPTGTSSAQKVENQMDQTIRKMQHKENKLAAARQSFKEQEALVYQQLAQLIRDGVWLKSYLAAVMRLEQEAFQASYAALGPSKAQLPLPPMSPDGITSTVPPAAEPAGASIPASRPFDAAQVTGKRLAATGKENGGGLATSAYSAKDEMPAVPTQPHRRTESRGYDRYGEQNYGARGDPVPAW
ncbi:hypothetical protein COCOBI_05-2620 [Coccomyxa sp. Obi]|nr:hypothetical protein COCOBI_05-2620 [Coccomyxa sp. Obi]